MGEILKFLGGLALIALIVWGVVVLIGCLPCGGWSYGGEKGSFVGACEKVNTADGPVYLGDC